MLRKFLFTPAAGVKILAITILAAFFISCYHDNTVPHLDASPYTSVFGDHVLVFDDTMDQRAIQNTLDALHHQQKHNEFGLERYALLFKPGTYGLNVTVDYYVQALGLGRVPGDVSINGTVQSVAATEDNKVTTMFWRGAENFKVKPHHGNTLLWAVSQAAPYRRMHVEGSINFDKGGWASGGVLANSIVEGRAGLTTGQQWFTRNSEIGRWAGGNWNRVFVGVKGAPVDQWPVEPTTIIEQTPVVREKPFLTLDDNGSYAVFVPALRYSSTGVSWQGDPEAGELIGLSDFYLASPHDTAVNLNQALAAGKHLLLTPGIYSLDDTLEITHANTLVLGLGLPTLVPQQGTAAITVADVDGVKLAGVMVDAGPVNSKVLIDVGKPAATIKSGADHHKNPSSLHDVYCRVGGAISGLAEICLRINSHHVLVDHVWLWRADHGAGADWNVNKSRNGLVVNGDDVTIYGLFNEHFQGYQTLWNGERGRTYFYQSEIPYTPPSIAAWNDNGKAGFASYKVADHVQTHNGWGFGIYSFFRGEPTVSNNVRLENSMETPNKSGIAIRHVANFAGLNGGINHVINGEGPATEVGELTLYTGFEGAADQ
ncbi:adenylyl cyclase [Gilvimarinus polysaccharolyticus]|uniref:adenylyl cyclase n=1 Tax=Gilvimarinus polysaccharolyticus TaxID=863921 RepID=UPI001E55918F|nr:adenylyl cyclase [Gilvimarinus polysaccharolyticus]